MTPENARKTKRIETLTARERVLRTLRREPVDRFPIDLGAHDSTGISAFAYVALRRYLGLPADRIEIVDMMQMLARPAPDVLERFHIDTMLLRPGRAETVRWNPRGEYVFDVPRDAQPFPGEAGEWFREFYDPAVSPRRLRCRMPAGGYFFDGDWIGGVGRATRDYDRALLREAERIYRETPYATILIDGFGAYFGQDPEWLMRTVTDPAGIVAEHEALLAKNMARAGELIDLLGERVQLVAINADMGTQRSTLTSAETFERLSAPFIEKFIGFVHQNSDWKVFLHSCGSVINFLPRLVACGLDVLNPVQVAADGMDPAELKREFGADLIFWGGGCDTQRVLGAGTPDEVAANVRELVRAFKPDGGFVFNQVHNVLGDVPPENVVRMLDTAYAEAFYPDPDA